MAVVARWTAICLLAVASLSSLCEGACHQQNSVIGICVPGTVTGRSVFVDANVTIQSNELCRCNFRQTLTGDLIIGSLPGSLIQGCDVWIKFFSTGASAPIWVVDCYQDQRYQNPLSPGTQVTMNMTGYGRINSCLELQADNLNSEITVECEAKIISPTTGPPPTTSTQAPPPTQPPTPSTPPPTPPRTSSTPSSQPPSPSSQPQTPSSQPPTPSRQPPTPSSQPPTPSSQPPTPSRQPQTPSSQPPAPSSQPPTPSSQPPAPSSQPPTPSSLPTSQTSDTPSSPTGLTATTETEPPVPGTAEAYRFPVPEVAGGVAAGIIIIILLVICVTCCTSRKRDRKRPDEESLRGRDSPEMQEKSEGRGYAFDNLLYHASQRDLTGKSVTPTVSDADPQEYQATRGLEELYASVKKTITDSTDIM